ncbi:hypothetical protein ABZ671_01135 [Micromonospora sp. NPDC006766]|uniref:hypothetical protein n=1 Tax=Micromonospora sp. NPDC006766 TaxID=3154778 RepID=UPI0033E702EF
MAASQPGRLIRLRDREWTLQRVGGYMPWRIVHLPTQLAFAEASQAEARRRIASGWYARQITDRMRPTPAARRDWWQDPITGVWHLWTGAGIGDWRCWVHQRVCDPLTPITGDDILRLVARDQSVGDDVFVIIRQAVENRLTD